MSGKRERTAEKLIQAIHESKGLLTLAAKKAGVTYWTLWKYTKDYPTVAKAVEESKEGLLDLAEAKLYQEINNNNMTAIIFFLKTKGKSRGYIERQEVTGKDGTPFMGTAQELTDDELASIAAGSSKRATKSQAVTE
jgi:hypothetical protein